MTPVKACFCTWIQESYSHCSQREKRDNSILVRALRLFANAVHVLLPLGFQIAMGFLGSDAMRYSTGQSRIFSHYFPKVISPLLHQTARQYSTLIKLNFSWSTKKAIQEEELDSMDSLEFSASSISIDEPLTLPSVSHLSELDLSVDQEESNKIKKNKTKKKNKFLRSMEKVRNSIRMKSSYVKWGSWTYIVDVYTKEINSFLDTIYNCSCFLQGIALFVIINLLLLCWRCKNF